MAVTPNQMPKRDLRFKLLEELQQPRRLSRQETRFFTDKGHPANTDAKTKVVNIPVPGLAAHVSSDNLARFEASLASNRFIA